MALVTYRKFKGEIPSVDPHLLPADNAQYALNCEFTRGSLKSTNGGQLLANMQSNPVKGIFTLDGVNFYTWDSETQAFRCPIIDDSYNRFYFLRLSEGVLRVGTTLAASPLGPTPLLANTFRTGVPRPTVAPVLTLVDRTTLPEYPSAVVHFDVWYESGGKTYDKVSSQTFSELTPFKSYTITRQNPGSSTPTDATIAVKMVIMDGTTEILSTTVRPASTVRTQALPGTQEFNLADNTTSLSLTITWGAEDTRAYVYVFQNTWDEEGGPSPASTIAPTYLQDVQVQVTSEDFTGYRPFEQVNIYRTFGTSATYVGLAYTGTFPTFIDASRIPSNVKSALLSTDWDPAPTGLQGAEYMAGGILAVFKGNELYVSDPYRMHAFPYIFSFASAIRGIRASQQSLVVTCADGLYLLAGSSPSTARPVKLAAPQAGVAQRSMVNIDGGVAYASSDGVVLVDGTSGSMDMSQKLFTRERWQTLYGDILHDYSMRFSYQDGRLIVSSDTQAKGFILRFDEDVGDLARTNVKYDAAFQLPVEDALYYSVGTGIYKFNTGSPLAFDWWSRDIIFASPECFGAGFLRGDAVTLTIYMDDVQVYSQLIQPGYFRLPSGLPQTLRMSLRLQGTGSVYEISIAQTMAELKIG